MNFSSSKDNERKTFNEINITPLTDIFLVLLIIMMVVAPTFNSMDNAVDVPEVNNGINIEETKVTVSITKDGSIYVNGENARNTELVFVNSYFELSKDAKKKITINRPINEYKSTSLYKLKLPS